MQKNLKLVIERRIKIPEVKEYIKPLNQQAGGLMQNRTHPQLHPNPLPLNNLKHSVRNPKPEAC
jgi:hypothetical protein